VRFPAPSASRVHFNQLSAALVRGPHHWSSHQAHSTLPAVSAYQHRMLNGPRSAHSLVGGFSGSTADNKDEISRFTTPHLLSESSFAPARQSSK
jgi:hypothetical protein